MKFLILTDLNWHSSSKRIDKSDILALYESGTPGVTQRFYSIDAYWSIIAKAQPELVLLGGDLTGDGSCGHGFHTAFYYLLSLLEIHGIKSFYIRGDNDLDDYYSQVLSNSQHFSFIHEISGRVVNHKGINIGGLSFQMTQSKKEVKKALNSLESKVDILLAHAPLKRRTLLLEHDFKVVVTGHFDNKICYVNRSLFISFSNDSETINYGILNLVKQDLIVDYIFLNRKRRNELRYIETLQGLISDRTQAYIYSDNVPLAMEAFESLPLPIKEYEKEKNKLALAIKYLRGNAYRRAVELLIQTKLSGNVDKSQFLEMKKTHITAKHRLSKTMIIDYLGKDVSSA